MSLTPLLAPASLDALQPIGPVSVLGSEILEGECLAWGLGTFGAPTDPVSAGFFAVSPGRFRMTYPFHEQAAVVQGRVTMTDLDSGEVRSYGVGESWFVTQGTRVLWEVEGGVFIKHYLAVAAG